MINFIKARTYIFELVLKHPDLFIVQDWIQMPIVQMVSTLVSARM